MKAAATSDRELQQWMEGDVTLARAAEIESLLAQDETLRRRHAALVELRGHLETPDAWVEDTDLVAEVRRKLAAPEVTTPSSPRWRAWSAASAVLMAACVLLLVWRGGDGESPDFRRKGAPVTADAWVGLDAFRVDAAGSVQRLRNVMDRSDALAFAYTNNGQPPWAFLVVFGVDAAGTIHWYHPAYSSTEERPTSVKLHAGLQVELPDMVKHPLALGTLTLVGIFSNAPMSVAEVEARVRKAQQDNAWSALRVPALFNGAVQRAQTVEVK